MEMKYLLVEEMVLVLMECGVVLVLLVKVGVLSLKSGFKIISIHFLIN